MSTVKLSDAEAHELVMKRIETRTREEWQEILDRAAKVFDRQEAADRAGARNGSNPKSAKPSKKSSQKAA